MDYTLRYSARSNSESSVTAYTVPIGYQLNLKTYWHNNMYSMQNLDSPSKQQLLRENIDKNKTNFSFCRMYSTNQSLNNDNKPKKETLWQSVFRSATNLLGEHLTRGTSSFIKNWSSMNNPLSVTVVSPDFYKSVQQEKEHQLINPSESFIVPKTWNKESHSSGETLPNVLYDNEIMSHSAKRSKSDSNDSDKRWKEYKCMFVDFNKSQEKDLIKNEQIVNSAKTSDCKNEHLESHFNIVVIDDKGFTLTDDEPVMVEKPEELTLEIRQKQPQSPTKAPQEPSSVTSMLTNAYNKVVSGVADYLQLGSMAPEPQCDPNLDIDLEFELSSLLTKRGCSPKARLRRLHDVSSGRGRGRAKSQLRRSGVSQTRHRKERNRHECAADIKSDIDSWEELEYCAEDVDEVDHAAQPCHEDDIERMSFTFADVKLKRRKPEKSKNCVWGQLAVSPQNLDKGGRQEKSAFRQRLLSDSSVDSEESYFIVFEDDSSSDECDFETDVKSYVGTEETEDEEVSFKTKVRFNPMPIVHTMIQWNYAYRAARRGPWEEMARDRERFRSRINCIGHVLEPVLAKQHRMRVWHERFDDQNVVF